MSFDPSTTKFSAANALILAQASQAAYLDQPSARARARQLGFMKFEWIDRRAGSGDTTHSHTFK